MVPDQNRENLTTNFPINQRGKTLYVFVSHQEPVKPKTEFFGLGVPGGFQVLPLVLFSFLSQSI